MKYMGSKLRHRKQIWEAMQPYLPKDLSQYNYWEPFVGGANMLGYVNSLGVFNKCYGSDIDEDLIAYLEATAEGWMPPEEVNEDLYKAVKENPLGYPKPLVGYLAFSLSFGAQKWGSYRRDKKGVRDYSAEAYRGHLKDAENVKGAHFFHSSYELGLKVIPDTPLVIYLDPPYEGTSGYKHQWDQNAYRGWLKTTGGNIVFMSAYENPLPGLAVEVWRKNTSVNLSAKNRTKKATEKLFYLPFPAH